MTLSAPITKVQFLAFKRISMYKAVTKEDEKRLQTAIERYEVDIDRYYSDGNTDSALNGKVDEILNRSSYSKRYDVASVNFNDSYIYIDGKRQPLENKTNTTCVESYYFNSIEWAKSHYIHYTIDDYTKETISKKTGKVTPAKHYYFSGILSFYDLFMIAKRFDAVKTIIANKKNHNGEIVPLMYLRHGIKLCNYLNSLNIVPFERNARNYITEDFELEY